MPWIIRWTSPVGCTIATSRVDKIKILQKTPRPWSSQWHKKSEKNQKQTNNQVCWINIRTTRQQSENYDHFYIKYQQHPEMILHIISGWQRTLPHVDRQWPMPLVCAVHQFPPRQSNCNCNSQNNKYVPWSQMKTCNLLLNGSTLLPRSSQGSQRQHLRPNFSSS